MESNVGGGLVGQTRGIQAILLAMQEAIYDEIQAWKILSEMR